MKWFYLCFGILISGKDCQESLFGRSWRALVMWDFKWAHILPRTHFIRSFGHQGLALFSWLFDSKISSRLKTWWIFWTILKVKIFGLILPKKFSSQNIWLDFAQNVFEPKYLAWFCSKIFQAKIFELILLKKFSSQNI